MFAHQGFEQNEAALLKANLWLSRFEPLLSENVGVPSEDEILARIDAVHGLRREYVDLNSVLPLLTGTEGMTVASTVRQAATQLDSMERDLQYALDQLRGEARSGVVDVLAIQTRLAERAAKQELGVTSSEIVPEVLELKTAAGSWAAAMGTGLFGFAWTSFTLFHSIFMIGGMKQAVGWWALGLLGFYSIFYAVGIGMLLAALSAASTESIQLDKGKLKVFRKLGAWVRTKTYYLDPQTKAAVGKPKVAFSAGNNGQNRPAVLLNDVDGKEIALCLGGNLQAQKEIVEQINRYRAVNGC